MASAMSERNPKVIQRKSFQPECVCVRVQELRSRGQIHASQTQAERGERERFKQAEGGGKREMESEEDITQRVKRSQTPCLYFTEICVCVRK